MPIYYIGLSLLSNNEPGDNGPRKKRLKTAARAEARRILSWFNGSPIGDDEIAREENNRPFFLDHRADFNVSHSGNMAAVSLVKSGIMGKKSNDRSFPSLRSREVKLRTGIDIELVRPDVKIREIAEEFFTLEERDYIFFHNETSGQTFRGSDTDIARFFQIWTLKECFLKLRGFSVLDMRQAPSFIKRNGTSSFEFAFCGSRSSPISFFLYELTGPNERYTLASDVEGTAKLQPKINWFSQALLPLRSKAEIKAAHSPEETVNPKM